MLHWPNVQLPRSRVLMLRFLRNGCYAIEFFSREAATFSSRGRKPTERPKKLPPSPAGAAHGVPVPPRWALRGWRVFSFCDPWAYAHGYFVPPLRGSNRDKTHVLAQHQKAQAKELSPLEWVHVLRLRVRLVSIDAG